jgi:hypothetical protein
MPNSRIGTLIAGAAATLRASYGTSVAWQGGAYPGRVISPPRRAIEFLATTAGLNAANADVRFVLFSPTEFPGPAYPSESDTVTLIENGRTLDFMVIRAWMRQIAGVAHTLQLCVCRDAAPDAATATPAGPRKQYWPPGDAP